MSRSVALVALCMAAALCGTIIYVPVSLYERMRIESLDQEALAARLAATEEVSNPARRAELRSMLAGEWRQSGYDKFPDQFAWVWANRATGDETHQLQDRVRWRLVFAEQAVILLIGGGLLTFVVRRKRRQESSQ